MGLDLCKLSNIGNQIGIQAAIAALTSELWIYDEDGQQTLR